MKVSLCVAALFLSLLMPANAQDAGADEHLLRQGERIFDRRCAACHTVESGQNKAGPHLNGVIGREVGTVEGVRYSSAMRDLDVIWDETMLERFLSNPRVEIPRTSMSVRLPNPDQRMAVVAYLNSLTD